MVARRGSPRPGLVARRSRQFLSVLAMVLAIGCGHVAHVRPTPRHALDGEVAVGGPLAKVNGAPVPLPLSTVGASYGFAERWDAQAHLHVTSVAFGVAGLDLGASHLLFDQGRYSPAVTLEFRLYGFSDSIACGSTSTSCGDNARRGARAYGELEQTASYLLRRHFLTYLSATEFLQFHGGADPTINDGVLPPVLFAVAAGEEFQVGRFGLTAELRWYEPNVDTSADVVNWLSIGGHGAWGIVLGLRYRFGGT